MLEADENKFTSMMPANVNKFSEFKKKLQSFKILVCFVGFLFYHVFISQSFDIKKIETSARANESSVELDEHDSPF